MQSSRVSIYAMVIFVFMISSSVSHGAGLWMIDGASHSHDATHTLAASYVHIEANRERDVLSNSDKPPSATARGNSNHTASAAANITRAARASCSPLYIFGTNPVDGVAPEAGLIQGSDGSFYGTTYLDNAKR